MSPLKPFNHCKLKQMGNSQKIQRIFAWRIATAAAFFSLIAFVGPLLAGGPIDDRVAQKLLTMNQSVVQGKPFREALVQLAQRAQLNIWLDRKIDPGADIRVGNVGPTIYNSLKQIAQANKCVVGVVDNVVLVGRPKWVNGVITKQLDQKKQREKTPPMQVDISWPRASTPTDAFLICGGTDSITLPHDLWPQTQWKAIDRDLAKLLIRSQFDSFDVETRSGDVFRSAVDRYLVNRQPRKRKPFDLDEKSLKLTLSEAPVDQVLNQLAMTAGHKLHISPDAAGKAKQRIQMQVENVSMRELVSQVVNKVGLRAMWAGGVLKISE